MATNDDRAEQALISAYAEGRELDLSATDELPTATFRDDRGQGLGKVVESGV